MGKKTKIWVLTAVLVIAAATAFAFADTYDPGSAGDPVVTKSYVDAEIVALKAEITALKAGIEGSAGSGGGAVFTAINIKAGQKLIGGAGTEMILRSGEAYAIDNGKDGVSDVTAAADIAGGKAIAANHLLIVPRDDGRGIGATTDLWVMVKGAYSIK